MKWKLSFLFPMDMMLLLRHIVKKYLNYDKCINIWMYCDGENSRRSASFSMIKVDQRRNPLTYNWIIFLNRVPQQIETLQREWCTCGQHHTISCIFSYIWVYTCHIGRMVACRALFMFNVPVKRSDIHNFIVQREIKRIVSIYKKHSNRPGSTKHQYFE